MKYFEYARKLFWSPKNLLMRKLARPISIDALNFEVTRRCNGQCVYCGIWKDKQKESEITPYELLVGLQPRSLFKKVKIVGVTGGEITLRQDLLDVCFALREICPEAHFGLVTNGLNPEKILQILRVIRNDIDPTVSIGVSLDGFSEVDNFQRGNPNHSKLAWKTVRLLKECGFPVGVGSVVTPYNLPSLEAFSRGCWKQGIPHGVMTANLSEHYYSNKDNTMMQFQKVDLEAFERVCNVGKVNTFTYYFPKYIREQRQIMPCFSGFNSFFLNSVGNVYPCIHLNKPFGNIREQQFGSFWKSEEAKLIRRGISQGYCHCYTTCEVHGWVMANFFPAIKKLFWTHIRRSN